MGSFLQRKQMLYPSQLCSQVTFSCLRWTVGKVKVGVKEKATRNEVTRLGGWQETLDERWLTARSRCQPLLPFPPSFPTSAHPAGARRPLQFSHLSLVMWCHPALPSVTQRADGSSLHGSRSGGIYAPSVWGCNLCLPPIFREAWRQTTASGARPEWDVMKHMV